MSRPTDDRSPRILRGHARGRALQTPPGLATRPLRAMVRRSLFDMLGPRVDGAAVLDLYAGAGGVGFEAFSRGATRVVMVERDRAALTALRHNLRELRAAPVVTIVASPVEDYVATARDAGFDLVFVGTPYPLVHTADPAYFQGVLPHLQHLVGPGGTVVLEAPTGFSPSLEGLSAERFREYGETTLHFLERS